MKRIVFLLVSVLFASSSYAAEKIYFVQSDHLGTPHVLTDENQAVVWKAGEDPFGDSPPEIEQIEFNLRFPGQYFDSETGFHYNWNRYYDPKTGRYITSDPIGLDGGLNTFGYVNGNPLKYTDPKGLQVEQGLVACTAGPNPVCVGSAVATACKWTFIAVGSLYLMTKSDEACDSCDDDTKSPRETSRDKRRAAREAQRQNGTPTSRSGRNHQDRAPGSPRHQTKPGADGTLDGVVDGSRDRVAGHGPHIEAGKVKANEPFNKHNQPRLKNGKSKVDF